MKSGHTGTPAFSMDKEQIRRLGYENVDIITDELVQSLHAEIVVS